MTFIIPLAIGIAGLLLQMLLAPKPKHQYGSRLSDVNVPSVTPGNMIAQLWGTMKLAGQVLWVSRLVETTHTQSQGGKGGGSAQSTTYTYAVDCAIGVCRGPVTQVNRIWANQKIVWVNPNMDKNEQPAFDSAFRAEFQRLVEQEYMTDYDQAYVSAFFFAFNNYKLEEYTYNTQATALAYITSHALPNYPIRSSDDVNFLLGASLDGLGHDMQYATYKIRYDQIDIYLGHDDQCPNPQMESWIGYGQVPAYRGLCYFVIHNLQLEDFGDSIPSFSIEVQANDGSNVMLYEIVNAVCQQSGLADEDFDTVSLVQANAAVDGFAITQQTSARDQINELQKVFPFDAAESHYRLTFNWINRAPVALLDRSDFGTHIDSDEMPPSEAITRIHDLDLPRRLNLKFQEPARNYSPNEVFAMRTDTVSQAVEDRDVVMAMSRKDAKTWAEEQLSLMLAARMTRKVILPRKYAVLEPGDIVMLKDKTFPDTYHTMRLTEQQVGANGIVELTFCSHFHHIVPTAAVGTDSSAAYDGSPTTAPMGSATVPYLLDVPLLTDTEADKPGFYAVLEGTNSSWSGGTLLVDMATGSTVTAFGGDASTTASGANWKTIMNSKTQNAHGWAMSVMSANCQPMMWDRETVLNVYMRNRDMSLSSATTDDILTQAANICLIGDELCCYANAVDKGNGNWQLSTILRGLRGTEGAMGAHKRGERFLRLQSSVYSRITHDTRFLNTPASFKAMSFNQDQSEVSAIPFTNTGNSLRPRAPQIRHLLVGGDRAIHMEWLPRARQNGNLTSGSTVKLDQAAEMYELDIVDTTTGKVLKTYSFPLLILLISFLRSIDYSASNQIADGLDLHQPVTLNLYQIGATIGRGYVSSVTIPGLAQ